MSRIKICIATASNLRARRWRNEEISWDEFLARFLNVRETAETAEEYRAMDRDTQTRIKDVGAFVGGRLRDGIRKKDTVEARHVVTLDYDSMPASRVAEIRAALEASGWAWAMHSTHKHTERDARLRVAVPADRGMTPDEYGAVSRRVAERLGFEGIDRSTFEPSRLMFWGSRSKGAPFVAESGEGEALSVDETLASYADWTDMSLWPMTEEEAGAFAWEAGTRAEAQGQAKAPLPPKGGATRGASLGRKAGDPRQKRGLVGLFCRKFTVEEVISRWLQGAYTYHSPGRYTHTASTTAGGAVVEDGGLHLYSFHSTDPCSGKNCNAWDLLRIHRFGHLDCDAEPGTRVDRLPSSREMEAWAMELPEVRAALMEERRREMAEMAEAPQPPKGGESDSPSESDEAWELWEEEKGRKLTVNRDGSVKATITNCAVIIDGDPRLKGKIRLDDFSGQIKVEGELPWRRTADYWGNNDDAMLRGFLDKEYGISGAQKIDDALVAVANEHGYHPVRSYLEALTWDGVKRVDGLFTDILGAADTRLNRKLAELLAVGAVSRVMEPGCKFDYFVIVKGPEGCGKSSLFSLLGGEWFSDSVSTIEGKEGMEAVQGKWIIEMAELIQTKRAEAESIKSFISRQTDRYRPAYGRKEEQRPRQCVMVGTTNEDYFLRGITTGNRRSPVVEIMPELRKVEEPVREWVSANRDQVWAEAVALYRQGYPLFLDDEMTAAARETQDAHNLDRQNALFPEVERFLDLLLPSDWETDYSQAQRVTWLEDHAMKPDSGVAVATEDPFGCEVGAEEPMGFAQRTHVTVPEILQELLKMKRTDPGYNQRSREIGQYLNTLKGRWEPMGTRRNKLYGVQKTWKRCNRNGTSVTSSVTGSVTPLGNILNDL